MAERRGSVAFHVQEGVHAWCVTDEVDYVHE